MKTITDFCLPWDAGSIHWNISFSWLEWPWSSFTTESLGWKTYSWWSICIMRSEAYLPDINVFWRIFQKKQYSVRHVFLAVQPPTRGDWKYVKEIFEMRHWWKYRAGICYKCFSTLSAGPYQHLERFDIVWFVSCDHFGRKKCICSNSMDMWESRYSNVEAFDRVPRMSLADFYNRALMLSSMEKCFGFTPKLWY